MKDEQVRDRVRRMVKSGEIPCAEPGKVWAGRGNGSHCIACSEEIGPTEIEFEVDLPSGVRLRLHRACHNIWLDECEPANANG